MQDADANADDGRGRADSRHPPPPHRAARAQGLLPDRAPGRYRRHRRPGGPDLPGHERRQAQPKRSHRARAELAQIETAIEAYKTKLGFYPPDNPLSPPNWTINQLYYELLGTTITIGGQPGYQTLDGSARIADTPPPSRRRSVPARRSPGS